MKTQPYFAYVRKSTDDPKRQVRSIKDQKAELRELASKHNLYVSRTFEDHMSAKRPGRPDFNEMLERIERGEAYGVLAWNPDRLARNMLDAGRLIHLIDIGKLKDLKFPSYWFENTAQGKFTLAMGLSQGKYYVDSMSESIKRGLRHKAEDGMWPTHAPLGYLNNPVTKGIIPDPEKAPLVRAAFELYATGNVTLAQLQQAINDMGLTTHYGKPLSISNYHIILANPVYYGMFRFHKELYEGQHEPIVTKRLFDKCQEIMKRKSKPKSSGLKPFLYRGVFLCGHCGCFITTECQKGHHYLRCTKRVDRTCPGKYVREERIREQVSDYFNDLTISPEDTEQLISTLESERDTDAQSGQEIIDTLFSRRREVDAKLKRLIEGYISREFSLEEYLSVKVGVLNEKQQIKDEIAVVEKNRSSWFEPAIRFAKSLQEATLVAATGTDEEKRDFLKKIGSNLKITERQLSVEPRGPWKYIVNQGRFAHPNAAQELCAANCLGESNLNLQKSG